MPITPGLCSACGGGGGSSTPEFEHNSVILCDTLADGSVVAAVVLVQEYDETTGLPVGTPIAHDPVTGAVYVPVGTLKSCSSPETSFEDVLVCATVAGVRVNALRREVQVAGLPPVVTFMDGSGAVVVPDSWSPGGCTETCQVTSLSIVSEAKDANLIPIQFAEKTTANGYAFIHTVVDGFPTNLIGSAIPGNAEFASDAGGLDVRILDCTALAAKFTYTVQKTSGGAPSYGITVYNVDTATYVQATSIVGAPTGPAVDFTGDPTDRTFPLFFAPDFTTVNTIVWTGDLPVGHYIVGVSVADNGATPATVDNWIVSINHNIPHTPCDTPVESTLVGLDACTMNTLGQQDTTTSDLVCADGVPMLRTTIYNRRGFLLNESFTTADGQGADPTSWVPGACAGPDSAPVFAGFVCDIFGGSAVVPRVFPSCPGSALAPVASNTDAFFVDGVTEGPTGTYLASGPGTPFWAFSKVPIGDENQAFCSVEFTLDGNTGADPNGWQLAGSGADFLGNGVNIDAIWISAIEAAIGVGDAADIPLPFTATATTGDGHVITMTVTGPTTHFQMFAGNGVFAFRETDNDGLSATVRLDFAVPMQTFTVAANVLVPSPGSVSGFQIATATPGTSAIPAQPAGIFQVKQFRSTDGSSFYENLDGSAHTVQGTIGECGEYTQEILCDATGASFIRVYKIAGGTIASFQDYDFAGAVFAANAPVGTCSETLATYRHTPTEVLCYTAADGTVTEFLRRYLINQDGIAVVAVIDTLLDGTTAFVAFAGGTVAQCGGNTEDCESTVLGTICYTPPPTSTISPGTHRGPDDWAGSTTVGANGGPQTITNANFAGAGITVISTDSFGSGIIAPSRIAMAHPAAAEVLTLNLGAPRLNVTLLFNSFGPAGTEVIDSFSPAFTSISGDGVASVGNTQIGATLPAGAVSVHFAGPVQTINYHARTTTGQFALQSVEFDEIITSPLAQTKGTASVVRNCATGAITYIDLATGVTLNLATIVIVDCESATAAVVTANAQSRLVAAGQSWTPGTDVVGTLTGLAFTVITGTATVTDSNGTVAAGLPLGLTGSWEVSDANALTGPQSIAAVGGNTWITWTQR